MIGQAISHYRITEKLGQGGMGEVHSARDTRLNRDVALEVLPEMFAGDEQRMRRFSRKAQVLDEALPIALQIAEASENSYEKGIIHQGLKPANIKLTPEGKVKSLAFGLAQALEDPVTACQSGAGLSQSPTLSMAAMQAGMISGTVGYMSPEQTTGKPIDRRVDIRPFKVVLSEMLAGTGPFRRETITDVIGAVVTRELDVNPLPKNTPARVRRLLHRSLVCFWVFRTLQC